ncbi:hypothetical protein CKO_04216 [Citrobacter koseri ATCC BAA-895]|uniref:Uncharacterized protein n=1 Tax=Citrobacter koseri (strain ATCC BAA-895 / CDC 4225-83 / SGSC4696) TaxID=290338 RepID=A8AP61_CITK8|nr:hypothetical protein CKO_04216 [Citrobacter koseri ATCC BAA-895]
MKDFNVAQVHGCHRWLSPQWILSISFLHRLAIKRYFLFPSVCGVIIKNVLPGVCYATFTELH